MGGRAGVGSGWGSQLGLFGRGRELAELLAALDDAKRDAGRPVMLTGDAGIGKSRLASELAAAAAGSGFRVLWGRCWEGSGAPAYWPWVQVLRTYAMGVDPEDLRARLGSGLAPVANLVPEIASRLDVPPAPEQRDPEQARFALFDATSRFLRAVATEQPLVLILDDLHRADHSSLLLLSFVASQLADMPVVVVGSYRDLEASVSAETGRLLGDIARLGTHLPLRGLDAAAVAAFVDETFDVRLSGEAAEALHELTGGNPFFVGEVVRLLVAEGRLADLPQVHAVPPGVRETIRRRLALLPEPALELLGAAAVADTDASLHMLERIADVPRSEVADALQEAVGMRVLTGGMLGSYAFAHELIRETVYADLPASRRAGLHRRVAETLEQMSGGSDDHVARIAEHFFRAALLGDDAVKVVEYAQRAARRACAVLAYDEAVHLYERALSALELAGPDEALRCRLLLGLGDARWRAGDRMPGELFLEAAELARRVGVAEMFAEAALGYGNGVAARGAAVDDTLLRLLTESLELLGPADSPARLRVLARLTSLLVRPQDDARRAACASEGIAMAQRLGDPESLLLGLDIQLLALLGVEELEERLTVAGRLVELAERLGDGGWLDHGIFMRYVTLLVLGRDEEAYDAMRARSEVAERFALRATRWDLARRRAGEALERGELEEAERRIAAAMQAGRGLPAENVMFHYAAQTAVLRWLQGRFSEVEPMIGSLQTTYPQLAGLRLSLILLYAESGRHADARAMFAEAATQDFAGYRQDALSLSSLWALGVASAVVRDEHVAGLLYDLLAPCAHLDVVETWIGTRLGPVELALGICAAVCGRTAEAVGHLQRAHERCEQTQNRPMAAVALRELAAAHLDAGDVAGASASLNAAVRIIERYGLEGVAPRTREIAERVERERGLQARFIRDADGWQVAWAGFEARVTDTRGMGYLQALLARPGRHVPALELAAGPRDVASRAGAAELEGTAADAGPLLDEQAIEAYKRQIEELTREAEQAGEWNDPERAAAARTEIEALTRELSRGLGLGGRRRRAGSPAERARVNVTRAIRSAIDRITQVHPQAGKHLDDTVRTGTFCVYDPPEPVRFTLYPNHTSTVTGAVNLSGE